MYIPRGLKTYRQSLQQVDFELLYRHIKGQNLCTLYQSFISYFAIYLFIYNLYFVLPSFQHHIRPIFFTYKFAGRISASETFIYFTTPLNEVASRRGRELGTHASVTAMSTIFK